MKKTSLLILLAFSILTASLPACRVKEGCPTNGYTNRMDKKRTKSGKTNLFDKSMRHKMN